MLGIIKSKKARRNCESNTFSAKYLKQKRVFPYHEHADESSKQFLQPDNQALKDGKANAVEENKQHNEKNKLITSFFTSKRFCTEVSNESSDKLIEIPQSIGAIQPSLPPQSIEVTPSTTTTTTTEEKLEAKKEVTKNINEEHKADIDISKGGSLLSVKDITLANFGYTAPPKATIKARRSTQKSNS